MQSVCARKVLLAEGWADNVRLHIEAGRITAIETGVDATGDDALADCVVPGLCNSHSHAFQRALAGHTEQGSPAGHDNFWSWRERMYELAAVMTAERLRAVACQAYTEMLVSGYTSVAEFHYLHSDPGGGTDDAMFHAVRDAASTSGIRLTYVPVLYERGGFDQPEPQGSQVLFATSVERFLSHHERVTTIEDDRLTVGIGAHSLRAVSRESLSAIVAAAGDAPIHIHVAEQQLEVEQCLASYESRPVNWLLENFDIGRNWCLVHATHMNEEETHALAESGAVVSLCPSTEGNLGDGLFPLADFLEAGGRIAIGSDSQITINPFEELRWLEYGQRLAARSRNVAATNDSHVGRELFQRTMLGGAQACGHADSGIAAGAPADLVCLYGEDPMLLGHSDASRLDALVFSGYQLPIERVMVAGEWCVVDGEHIRREQVREDFAAALDGIADVWGRHD